MLPLRAAPRSQLRQREARTTPACTLTRIAREMPTLRSRGSSAVRQSRPWAPRISAADLESPSHFRSPHRPPGFSTRLSIAGHEHASRSSRQYCFGRISAFFPENSLDQSSKFSGNRRGEQATDLLANHRFAHSARFADRQPPLRMPRQRRTLGSGTFALDAPFLKLLVNGDARCGRARQLRARFRGTPSMLHSESFLLASPFRRHAPH